VREKLRMRKAAHSPNRLLAESDELQDRLSLDWDNIRVFLAVAKAGSFRTASSRLGMTANAIGHRIGQLERRLRIVLFTRHRSGVRLTEEGKSLLSSAEAMEDASIKFIRGQGVLAQPFQGEVRIAVTEGLGTFWFTPRLIEFVRNNPKILVDLHCSMQRPDNLVLQAQADLAVQIEKPTVGDLVQRKIGCMHVLPCASKEYLETYGVPRSTDDIGQKHRLAMQYADQGRGREYYEKLFGKRPQVGFMAMRTDASTAMYSAVLNGLAVGWLPTYYFSIGAQVVPLDIGHHYPFDIWLSYHPDAARSPRVRRMIDWTISAFNPNDNPWFRETFVHPKDFQRAQKLRSPPNIIGTGFAGPAARRRAVG
jgi:DNA-binding transcriptional LysR family regulator